MRRRPPKPPEPRGYQVVKAAIVANTKDGGAWLCKDQKSLTLSKELRGLWYGDEAEEIVTRFHREQAEKQTWPEVSYFHTTTVILEAPFHAT